MIKHKTPSSPETRGISGAGPYTAKRNEELHQIFLIRYLQRACLEWTWIWYPIMFFRLISLMLSWLILIQPDSLVEEKDKSNTSNFYLRGCVNLMAFPYVWIMPLLLEAAFQIYNQMSALQIAESSVIWTPSLVGSDDTEMNGTGCKGKIINIGIRTNEENLMNLWTLSSSILEYFCQ